MNTEQTIELPLTGIAGRGTHQHKMAQNCCSVTCVLWSPQLCPSRLPTTPQLHPPRDVVTAQGTTHTVLVLQPVVMGHPMALAALSMQKSSGVITSNWVPCSGCGLSPISPPWDTWFSKNPASWPLMAESGYLLVGDRKDQKGKGVKWGWKDRKEKRENSVRGERKRELWKVWLCDKIISNIFSLCPSNNPVSCLITLGIFPKQTILVGKEG